MEYLKEVYEAMIDAIKYFFQVEIVATAIIIFTIVFLEIALILISTSVPHK